MTFTLSPPIRYAALLGLLAAVLIGGGMTVLGHRDSSVATPHVITHHPFGPGVKTKTTVVPKKHSTKAAKAKATPTVPVAPKAPEKPSAVIAALAAGLPVPIAAALGRHQTVVVSLYNPYSQVDGIAFAEARAGAKMAGVGFVPLNVLSEAQVGNLTQMLGLLPDPGVLVYIRPGTLLARISGFADKETVAQAAQNAARGT
ncbi:MAG: hypothetical protein M3R37_02000 [Actinomycetota bacterium]|nr:hypothetical protein [Actinomycetota bacterium]